MALYDALQKRLNKSTVPLLAEAGKTDVGAQIGAIQAASSGKEGTQQSFAPSLAEQAAASGAIQDVKQAAAQTSLQAQSLGQAEQQNAANTQLANTQLDTQLRQGQQQLATQAYSQRAGLASSERMSLAKLHSQEEMKSDSITSTMEQSVANLLSNRKLSENDIFSSFHQDERDLEFRRDQAAIEQVGTMLALRDRMYVDELSRIGRQRNLDDQQAFERESSRLILGEQTSAYLDKLKWSEADLIDNLEFSKKMANMNIGQAWALLKMASDSKNAAMIASGATAITSAGIQYGMADKPVATASPNTQAYDAANNSVYGAGQVTT
jgi:hypothetical protein